MASSTSRTSRYLTLAACVTLAVLAPIEFAPAEEPVVVLPEMLFLLGVSCAGLALGMWAREPARGLNRAASRHARVAVRAPRK